jgi:hypothetical protein
MSTAVAVAAAMLGVTIAEITTAGDIRNTASKGVNSKGDGVNTAAKGVNSKGDGVNTAANDVHTKGDDKSNTASDKATIKSRGTCGLQLLFPAAGEILCSPTSEKTPSLFLVLTGSLEVVMEGERPWRGTGHPPPPPNSNAPYLVVWAGGVVGVLSVLAGSPQVYSPSLLVIGSHCRYIPTPFL